MPYAANIILILASALVCFCGTASAQNFSSLRQKQNPQGSFLRSHRDNHCYGNGHRSFRPTTFGYGSYHWYRGYNGHEIADVVRSQATANFVNAQARIQDELARSARMENSIRALETHLARRSINTERRFGHLHARGEFVRAAKAEVMLVTHQMDLKLHDEDKLTSKEINVVTGQLYWPLLLRMEHYENARKPVDEIFVTRARVGRINPDHYLPLCDWIEKVRVELTKNVDHYPQADYAEAQSFLRRLIVEARLPTSTKMEMQFATK